MSWWIPIKTPSWLQRLFPELIWKKTTPNNVIYLTFDDGPTPQITQWVLDVLKQYNAKATFFCIGNNIRKYPEITKAIYNAGHTVANHTFHHIKGWQHNSKDYCKEIDKTQQLIASVCNNDSTLLFRPPHGQITKKQTRSLLKKGYKIIMWNMLTKDWDSKIDCNKVVDTIIKSSKNGDIIVCHDSLKASKQLHLILPKLVKGLTEKGFKLEALD